MRLKKSILLGFLPCVLVLLSTSGVWAGERMRMAPGTVIIGGNISYNYDNSGSSQMETGPAVETLEFNPSVGVFLRRGLALTASWQWMHRDMGDESDNANAGAFGVRIIGGQETFFPYFGLELQYRRLSGIVDLAQVGLRISFGLLFPLNSRIALDTGLKLSVLQGNAEIDGEQFDYGNATLSFGYFGIVGTFDL